MLNLNLNNMTPRIETDMPIPTVNKWKDFPLQDLEVGHSIYYADATKKALEQRLFKWRLDNDRKLIKKFKILEMYGGARIWRIA